MNIKNEDSSLKGEYLTTHFGVAGGARFIFVWRVGDRYPFALISRYNQPEKLRDYMLEGKYVVRRLKRGE